MHWGSDTRPIGADECLRRAEEIIGVKGFQVIKARNAVAGQGPDVVVLVECTPIAQGTDILVVATSPANTPTAERTRNEVRIAVMR